MTNNELLKRYEAATCIEGTTDERTKELAEYIYGLTDMIYERGLENEALDIFTHCLNTQFNCGRINRYMPTLEYQLIELPKLNAKLAMEGK